MRGPKGPLGGPWGNPKCPKMAELQQNLVIFPFKSYLNYLTNLFSTSFDLSSNFVKEKGYSWQKGPFGIQRKVPNTPKILHILKIYKFSLIKDKDQMHVIWFEIWFDEEV